MIKIPQSLPRGVSRTALLVVLARAIETAQPDRLITDPYAAMFVAAAGCESEFTDDMSYGGSVFALRELFFDTQLRHAVARGARQVVLLGAGLDSRAYRLDWLAGTTVFEVELPETLEFKEAQLEQFGAVPHCERMLVPADLREDWTTSLIGAGFRPEEPTVWLVQGLSYYLTARDNDRWLNMLTGLSARGSWLGFDHLNSALLNSPLFRPHRQSMIEMGAPWVSTLEDPQEWVAVHNWTAEVAKLHELAAAHHRLLPDTLSQPPGGGAHYWLVSSSYLG